MDSLHTIDIVDTVGPLRSINTVPFVRGLANAEARRLPGVGDVIDVPSGRRLPGVGDVIDVIDVPSGRVNRLPPVVKIVLPTPVLAFTGKEARNIRGNEFWQVNLSITNWQDFSPDFFRPAPDLAPCGNNQNASRTWVDIYDAANDNRLYGFCAISSPEDLTKLWFSVPASQKLPKQVYVQFEDRRGRVIQKSNNVTTMTPEDQAPTYVPTRRELNQEVQPVPFSFSPALHSYMFQGVVPGSVNNGLIRYRLQWKGRFHTYLQDAANLKLVYFFPDQFKIARRQEAPFKPFVTVRVNSLSGTEDTDVLVDYMIAPFTEPSRLTEARIGLLADPRFGATEVQFQPFITSEVRFYRDRPTKNGSVKDDRSDVSLVLQGALKDSLAMKLPDFGVLFGALSGATASLFLGRMEIQVPGETAEIIPFTARMDDMAGELFLYTATADSDGTINVSLLNAIESPVQINALDVSLNIGGRDIPASVQGLVFPVQSLAPESRIDFKIVPQTALAESEMPKITFGVQDVHVLLDEAAILDAILDRSSLEFFNPVTVKAVPSLFLPKTSSSSDSGETGSNNTDPQNDQILAILVEFQGGGTAELNASQLEVTVKIDYPINDVILRKVIDESYTYTVTVIRADGRQEKDLEPRRQSARSFFVNVIK